MHFETFPLIPSPLADILPQYCIPVDEVNSKAVVWFRDGTVTDYNFLPRPHRKSSSFCPGHGVID